MRNHKHRKCTKKYLGALQIFSSLASSTNLTPFDFFSGVHKKSSVCKNFQNDE